MSVCCSSKVALAAGQPTHLVSIGLGSNLGHPLRHIQCAIQALNRLSDTQVLVCSRIYRSRALPLPTESLKQGRSSAESVDLSLPDFMNAVVIVSTTLAPMTLLDQLHQIEARQGRDRNRPSVRWGPRTLDLDIVLYGDQVIHNDRLTVPHPEAGHRWFVAGPLLEALTLLRLAFKTHCVRLGL